jgi:hypothetical protein
LSSQETVLPQIDPDLGERGPLPDLDIKDPQNQVLNLSNFGVVLKRGIDYYIRCLAALSDEPVPDLDQLEYLYEQVHATKKRTRESCQVRSIRYKWTLYHTDNLSGLHSTRGTFYSLMPNQ